MKCKTTARWMACGRSPTRPASAPRLSPPRSNAQMGRSSAAAFIAPQRKVGRRFAAHDIVAFPIDSRLARQHCSREQYGNTAMRVTGRAAGNSSAFLFAALFGIAGPAWAGDVDRPAGLRGAHGAWDQAALTDPDS